MSYLMNKANDIEYFIEGISAACNDKSLITKKVKERFGSEYSKLIDYLLLLENEKFNAKALAAAFSNFYHQLLPLLLVVNGGKISARGLR